MNGEVRVKLLGLAVTLAIANVLWTALSHQSIQVAIERTYFQWVALLLVALMRLA